MFNLNIMYHQRGRAADDAGFCQDVTIGGRSDMTSVDFNSDWNKLGQIDLPQAWRLAAVSARTILIPPCNRPKGWRARSDIGIRSRSLSASAEMISTPRASGAVFGSKARSCSMEVIRVKAEDIQELSVQRSAFNAQRPAANIWRRLASLRSNKARRFRLPRPANGERQPFNPKPAGPTRRL